VTSTPVSSRYRAFVAQHHVAANRLQPFLDVEQQPDQPERVERAVGAEDRRVGRDRELAGRVARLVGVAHRLEHHLADGVVGDVDRTIAVAGC